MKTPSLSIGLIVALLNSAGLSVAWPAPALNRTDQVGDTTVLGNTWYELQHHGTIGRMVVKDAQRYLQFVWTNGLDAAGTQRHVYWNCIMPSGQVLIPGGTQVDATTRAGFAVLDVAYGDRALPAFNEISNPGSSTHAAVAVDFEPHLGAFLPYEIPWLGGQDIPLIWPKMQIDRQGVIHVIATQNTGLPMPQYYISGTYDPASLQINYDPPWAFVDSTMTVAADVATSPVSNRVAFGWTRRLPGAQAPGLLTSNNDIYILIDEDGQNPQFSQAFNLTQFIPPDSLFLPDTLLADRDTLRAYTDMCLFFDRDDWLHVAFTTRHFKFFENYSHPHASIVWHWSEEFPGEFWIVHNAFDDWGWNNVNCGYSNVKAQRPSLGQSPETGNLYCMYQVFDCDTLHLSHAGYPSGEVYISVSVDNGLNWSVGSNVTRTITRRGAGPGRCRSEMYPSMAKWVDRNCHVTYILDLDAGTSSSGQGEATLDPVVYQGVPVNRIPTIPLVPQNVPFHVQNPPHSWHVSGEPAYEGGPPPASAPPVAGFACRGPTPNPFNPATSFSYDLTTACWVSLGIYDISGRLVERLVEGWRAAGTHQASFYGTAWPSGIYIYRISAGPFRAAGKMVLIK